MWMYISCSYIFLRYSTNGSEEQQQSEHVSSETPIDNPPSHTQTTDENRPKPPPFTFIPKMLDPITVTPKQRSERGLSFDDTITSHVKNTKDSPKTPPDVTRADSTSSSSSFRSRSAPKTIPSTFLPSLVAFTGTRILIPVIPQAERHPQNNMRATNLADSHELPHAL